MLENIPLGNLTMGRPIQKLNTQPIYSFVSFPLPGTGVRALSPMFVEIRTPSFVIHTPSKKGKGLELPVGEDFLS